MIQQQVSLTDELTGKGAIQTDHEGFTFPDLAVLLLDFVLFLYTGWRSYHFLTDSVPDGMQIMALVGLWGLDIGMVNWSLVWIFGSTEKYQDWTAMAFFIVDMIGVVLTSLTDSLSFSTPDGSMTSTLQGIAAPAIPLIVVANVIAGFIYHMTSPRTRALREARKAAAEHRRKMEEVTKMQRDLVYAESYIMAKQETLDKAQILAEIKVSQDAVEAATRAQLRDQVGIHNSASAIKTENKEQMPDEKVAALKASLQNSLRKIGIGQPKPEKETDNLPAPDSLSQPNEMLTPSTANNDIKSSPQNHGKGQPDEDLPAPAPLPERPEDIPFDMPQNYTPFIARLTCQFPKHNVTYGDVLEASQIPGGDYVVRVPGTERPFARLTPYDLSRLMSGENNEGLNPGGNGHKQHVPISRLNGNGNGNNNSSHPGNEESPT